MQDFHEGTVYVRVLWGEGGTEKNFPRGANHFKWGVSKLCGIMCCVLYDYVVSVWWCGGVGEGGGGGGKETGYDEETVE